jgi:hypothetical protein
VAGAGHVTHPAETAMVDRKGFSEKREQALRDIINQAIDHNNLEGLADRVAEEYRRRYRMAKDDSQDTTGWLFPEA